MECAVGGAAAHGEANRAHERGLVLADRLGVEIGRGRVELARLEGAKLAREDVVEDVVHVHLRKEEEEAREGAWVDYLGRIGWPNLRLPRRRHSAGDSVAPRGSKEALAMHTLT